MVFHTTVVEHVGANLRTPFNFLLSSFHLLLLCHLLLQSAVVELGAEQAQGILTIFQLLTSFGVFDEDFLFLACVGIYILIA